MKKILIIALAAFALAACTNKTEQQPSNEENTMQTDQNSSKEQYERLQKALNDTTHKELKVLLINGSPRKKGNTYCALMEAAKQLEKNGIATEFLQIGTQPMHGCTACNHCKKTGRCVFDDDLCNRAIDLMADCDAIIIGSPTMCYAAPQVMQNKPAAAVAVCRRGGASAVYQTLLMPFQMLNMPIVTSQYWNIVYGCYEGEATLDAEGLQTMRTMADNMAWMLKKIHNGDPDYPQREAEHKVTNFIKEQLIAKE